MLETLVGSFGCLTQGGLEFGKGQLDRIEVRTVSWKVEELGSAVFNCLAHSLDFMTGKVVTDNEVSPLKFGTEDLLDISQKHGSIHGAIDKQWSRKPIIP